MKTPSYPLLLHSKEFWEAKANTKGPQQHLLSMLFSYCFFFFLAICSATWKVGHHLLMMFLQQHRLLAQEEQPFTNLEFNFNTHWTERHSNYLKIYPQCTPQHLVVRDYPPKSTDRKISIPMLMRCKSSRNPTHGLRLQGWLQALGVQPSHCHSPGSSAHPAPRQTTGPTSSSAPFCEPLLLLTPSPFTGTSLTCLEVFPSETCLELHLPFYLFFPLSPVPPYIQFLCRSLLI